MKYCCYILLSLALVEFATQCVAHQVCVVEGKMSDSDLSKISDSQTESDSFG